ncbi:MAG: hypothetical protein RLZZ546_2736 [Bacteroidota bacterium]
MSIKINQLEPVEVWSRFAELNAVPRASKKEEKVQAFIESFAHNLGLPYHRDEVGNIIIRKPATQGATSKKPIILQAHIDMVHQKNNDTIFDFDTQGIDMYVDGDWVKARGTTLGADNGLGVACIMAILASSDIEHPAIEALFTIDEETGMTGALGLKGGILHGKILLNLDTEDDDEIDIGCAGGLDVTAEKNYETIVSPMINIGKKIEVKGLKGGHSGMDIHKGLGNSNKIMNRLLYNLTINLGGMIHSIDGGSLRNAIPRESTAIISIHPDQDQAFLSKFEEIKNQLLLEYEYIEPNLEISIQEEKNPGQAMDPIEEIQLVKAIYSAHNGVYKMSPNIDGLVEASNNVARVEVKNGKARILNLTRSSVESSKWDVANSLKSTFELGGFEVSFSGDYPGWSPNVKSEILKISAEIYKKLNHTEPRIVACHAGLECGILGRNYPGLDMISFGPTIKGAHCPDERASISSLQKFWIFLKEVLKNIPEDK